MNKTTEALKLAEEAFQSMLDNDGGEGSKCYSALRWYEARQDSYKALAVIREALEDHSGDATKMVVPEGYALISIEALKAWGKYDDVSSACRFPVEPVKQESVAWKETVRALTDQCAALVWERDELQKQVQRYERNGVTCQLYGHKVERSCSECNDDKNYATPVQPVKQVPVGKVLLHEGDVNAKGYLYNPLPEGTDLYAEPVDAKAIRAEELEETKEIAKTIGGSFADEFLAAIRGLK